jgi:hypothetical protein
MRKVLIKKMETGSGGGSSSTSALTLGLLAQIRQMQIILRPPSCNSFTAMQVGQVDK